MKKLKDNFTLMTDFYELMMANGYLENEKKDEISYFDVFFRTVPDNGGFAIFCGLETIVDYLENLSFSDSDIKYLKSLNCFSDKFLAFLKTFKFTGDIYSVPEGTVVFPNEPLFTIRGKALEVQFLETFILSSINHQSLIATKANRIVRSAKGKSVFEFGARRAHGHLSATLGARSAVIAGCESTSCVLAGKLFDLKVSGTMAHSWVQMFDTELEAFISYCKTYPDNASLLIDTYDTLSTGIYNAIAAFNEVLKPLGKRPKSVRIDSGDISYLSKKIRKILDENGYHDCKIVASNSLDEYIINELESENAKVDFYGVGERLITSKSSPVFDGVYKLVAVEKTNKIVPKIKISETVQKNTNPHFKKLYRFYDKDTKKALADLICVHDEIIDSEKPLMIFDPEATWKQKTLKNFTVRVLQEPIFKDGKLIKVLPKVSEIQKYCQREVDSLWDEIKRFESPHKYYVDLSQKLFDIKTKLLNEKGKIC